LWKVGQRCRRRLRSAHRGDGSQQSRCELVAFGLGPRDDGTACARLEDAGELAHAHIGVRKQDDAEHRDRRVEAAIGQAERHAVHDGGADAAGHCWGTVSATDNARHHLWRGVDCHDVASAASGDEGCAASARADIDQPITGRHIEAIERVSREGVRERLKHLFVHRNVIVPEFGVLVWLELRR